MKSILTGFTLLLLIISTVSAIQTDTISITLPPDSRECFDILLPDNMGVTVPGRYEFIINVYPDSNESWLDLTYLAVRPKRDESVNVPVCFSSIGQPIGNCSVPFNLTISAIGVSEIPAKTITGQACVAENRDVDTDRAVPGGIDVFDVALEKDVLYSKPGVKADFLLMFQSQAGVQVDYEVLYQGESIVNKSVQFGEESFKNATFSLKPAKEGEYRFIVVGRVRGCSDEICTKRISGTLVATDNIIDENGYKLSLFPKNIDVKDRKSVEFRATIENNIGSAKNFNLALNLPDGLSTDFEEQIMAVEDGKRKTIKFTVTPEIGSEQFSLTMEASGDGIEKKSVTSYISSDEMLTDTQNMASVAGEKADDVMDEYVKKYMDSDYNESLTGYEDTLVTIGEMAEETNDTETDNGYVDDTNNEDETSTPESFPLWIIVVIGAVGLVGGLLFMKFKGHGNRLDKEFVLEN